MTSVQADHNESIHLHDELLLEWLSCDSERVQSRIFQDTERTGRADYYAVEPLIKSCKPK